MSVLIGINHQGYLPVLAVDLFAQTFHEPCSHRRTEILRPENRYLKLIRHSLRVSGAPRYSAGTPRSAAARKIRFCVAFEIFRSSAFPFRTMETIDGDISSSFASCLMVIICLLRPPFSDVPQNCNPQNLIFCHSNFAYVILIIP